jgi:hypothetical protein
MKAHLLNWTLGPAMLAMILAAGGADPPVASAGDTWLEFVRTMVGLTGFFATWYLVMLLLGAIAHRLNGGRFVWAEVRLGATVRAIQLALLVFALTVLLAVRQGAVLLTSGWSAGWLPAVIGAVIGAAVGLPLGLGVAQLRIPQRLGLDKTSPASPG